MCDVIDSRSKTSNLLIENFKKCKNYVNTVYAFKIISPLTTTLGDEFQGLILDLRTSIEIIIALEEYCIVNDFQFKLRYVLIYGEIETEINTKIAYEMLGTGLTEARNNLNLLKKKNNRFLIDTKNTIQNTIINNSFKIFQQLVDKWNRKNDTQLLSSFIKNKDYKLVAKELNIDRSQIWKKEKSLNISSYLSIKEILTTIPDL
jgi:hypothetical protein